MDAASPSPYPTRRSLPRMPRTFRPSKSPARTRGSEEIVERPPTPAEAPPSRESTPVVPMPRLASPEEKALASSRHQEVMARSKSPPRQLRPNTMPKIAAPVSCAEAGYQGQTLRRRASPPPIVHLHPSWLWAAWHALEERRGSARTHGTCGEQPPPIAHFFPLSRCRR